MWQGCWIRSQGRERGSLSDPILTEIRLGLAARLETIAGQDWQVSPWWLDAPSPPSLVVVGLDDSEYDTGGFGEQQDETWSMIVQGFAGPSQDRASQEILDEWLVPRGTTSVKRAIEGDRTLGGVAQTCRVTGATGMRLYTLPNIGRVCGAEWTVHVETTRT